MHALGPPQQLTGPMQGLLSQPGLGHLQERARSSLFTGTWHGSHMWDPQCLTEQVAGCRWAVSGQSEEQQQEPRALGRQHSSRRASAHGWQICVPALSRQQATYRPLETTVLSKQMPGKHSTEGQVGPCPFLGPCTHKNINLQHLSLKNDLHSVMHQAVFSFGMIIKAS